MLVTDIWPWVDASVYSFIPLVIIATLNSLIVRHVVSARRIRRQIASFRSVVARGRPNSSSSPARRTPEALGGRQRARSSVFSRCEQGQDARMIALLLAVSFTFLAATLPRCAVLIATKFIDRSLAAWAAAADDPVLYQARIIGSVRLALAATDLLMYANHAVNFFLYCATGQKFRHQLCAVVFIVRQSQRASSSPFDVRGAVSEPVRLRQRGPRPCDNVLHDDSLSRRSADRYTAV